MKITIAMMEKIDLDLSGVLGVSLAENGVVKGMEWGGEVDGMAWRSGWKVG